MALFEGSVAFVMIAAVMKSMDLRLRRLADHRGEPPPHHAAYHPALGDPGVLGAASLSLPKC